MKTKVKRMSKRTLAVFLGVVMLVTSIGLGSIITTNAANSYKLQTGARYYLNTHNGFGGGVKAYVYCAFIWNDYQNYSIIKMDHIDNSEWYTCVTANGNIVDGNNTERRGDMDGVTFFTSDSGSWATKSKYFSDKGAHNDIKNNADSLDCYDTNIDGRDAYNNHVYYYNKNGLAHDYDDGTLAQSANETKAGTQKAQVWVSTNGSTYAERSTSGQGGEVQVGGYYWKTNYTTSGKGFSDASSGSTNYSQYENPVLTSWITMKVTKTYNDWHFIGWYDSSSDSIVETAETYYYDLQSSGARTVRAFFLNPTYSSTNPKSASTVPAGTLLFKKKSTKPTKASVYNFNNNDDNSEMVNLSSYNSGNTYYYYSNDRFKSGGDTPYPKAWVTTNNWDSRISGLITDNGSIPDSRVWLFNLNDNQNNGNWTNFVHLGATGLTVSKTTAEIKEEVLLTATEPATGTLKSGCKYSYYFSTDDGSTWKSIAIDIPSNEMKFFPPDVGTYKYKVAVTDGEGVETVVATAGSTTTVGVGYYVSGSEGLVGEAWGVHPAKGFMTAPSSGTIYKKVFPNVAAGTYQFRITDVNNYITGESTHGTYTVNGIEENPISFADTNNFQFTTTDAQQITITYDSSNNNVTVTTKDIVAIPVVVYAGSGGAVEVTYGTAVTEIAEGEHATIKVAYGDKIDLEATPLGGTDFEKWYKNLVDGYKGTPEKASGYDSLEDEVITQRTVYTAVFSGGGGSWVYSGDRSNASPEISGDTSSYNIIYSGSDSGVGTGSGNPNGYVATYNSGSNYWADLSSIFGNPPSTPNRLYIALANGTGNNNMVGDSDTKINGSSYSDGNGPTIKNSSNENLFTVREKQHSTVNNTIRYIEIDGIDWTKISALGVRAVYSGSGSVNYKFYYKLAGGGGEGSTEYIPSTNFYAKDSSIRDDSFNYWIYPTKTSVTAVEGEVRIDDDHTDNHHWVEGFALKGSEITVTTVIPERGKYKTIDKNGNVATDKKANEKYYVAGFSFNGVTPELIDENSGKRVSGITFAEYDSETKKWTKTWTGAGTAYSCTYKIPTDMKEAKLEITPIIFVKEEYASNTVMVYINGYSDSIKNAGWGNTLYMYPFYQYRKNGVDGDEGSYHGQGENFGRYPGQPIINYGGQLFCQIPLTDDASANGKDNNGGPIKGITVNNGYYDDVHKTYCNHVSVHRQTYDYDDFAKIYNQKKTKNSSKYLYSIYFSFKYKDKDSSKQHRLNGTTSTIKKDENASRYNDLLASGNILSNTSGTVAAATLTTAGDNSGGWEDLTDSLGNNVDVFGNKVTNASAEPLRVFSLGYEDNNAGHWATEWAVYHLNGANYELIYDDAWGIDSSSGHNNKYYNSSIVPSALIYNDKASLAAATSLDRDQQISGYAGLYEKLEAYRGVPVKICYEYDIPDAFSPNNYRCDGRWTYTTVDDYVRSNIKIQYYDKDGVLHYDTIPSGDNTGETTGCSAYFTNSKYYGKTQSDSEIIDNSKSYTFKAENKGSYEFVGWYMYDTAGHESTISKTSKTADTPRSGNFVLAARFKYIASGNLTISNSLATGNTGRATTYLGVTVRNGDKENTIANVNSNTDPVTLDKSYINANSNYQIEIKVRTVPIGENKFASYTCYTTDGHTGTDVRSTANDTDIYKSSNSSHTTDTYTITVKGDIFDSTTTNQQNVKAIEYVSTLTPVTYNYTIKYNYTSRSYGDQAYTKTGSLTSGQINDEDVVTGTMNTADKKLTKEFLAEIAPHESNFNKNISWNFDAVHDNQSCNYNSGTNTYAISLTIEKEKQVVTENLSRTGYFTVPYAQTNGVATANGEGKVTKTAPTSFNIDVNYDELFYTSGTSFVTAPKVIYETVRGEEKERKFKYWEIRTASSARGDSKVVGKCYYPEFNYRALDNYNIKAVYTETDEDTATYGTLYASEAGKTSIAFIGNSRNQWNNNDKGSATYYAGDLIYNDFIFSFKPQSSDLFKNLANTECGMIIQRLKDIETNSSGANAKTLQEYAKDYSAADLEAAKAAAATKASGSNAAGYKQMKISLDSYKSSINDKNRLHYAHSFFATAKTTSEAAVSKTNSEQYLYRAYSYMKIGDGEYILSDEPAYFYMYDIAKQ